MDVTRTSARKLHVNNTKVWWNVPYIPFIARIRPPTNKIPFYLALYHGPNSDGNVRKNFCFPFSPCKGSYGEIPPGLLMRNGDDAGFNQVREETRGIPQMDQGRKSGKTISFQLMC